MVDVILDTIDFVLHHFVWIYYHTSGRRNRGRYYFSICNGTMDVICQMDL